MEALFWVEMTGPIPMAQRLPMTIPGLPRLALQTRLIPQVLTPFLEVILLL